MIMEADTNTNLDQRNAQKTQWLRRTSTSPKAAARNPIYDHASALCPEKRAAHPAEVSSQRVGASIGVRSSFTGVGPRAANKRLSVIIVGVSSSHTFLHVLKGHAPTLRDLGLSVIEGLKTHRNLAIAAATSGNRRGSTTLTASPS